MATSYKCDNCEETATSLLGWFTTTVGLFYQDPNAPNPPGSSVSLIPGNEQLVFHSHTCLGEWCGRAGVPTPPEPVTNEPANV